MRHWIYLTLIGTLVVWAEPSVYSNAGSYASPKKNRQSIIVLKSEISQLKQEIEGLKSIVEGLSQGMGEIKQKELNSNASNKINSEFERLSSHVEKINRSYVSKAELKVILAKKLKIDKGVSSPIHKQKEVQKKTVTSKPIVDHKLDSADSAALYSRGVRLVKKKKYSMAKIRFDILKKRGYKKASTNFYLGEIAYRTNNYSNAINYYKISAGINENANYMATLLLHTGISLEKRGEKEQAKRFFQAIIDGYPNTGSAKVAKKHL